MNLRRLYATALDISKLSKDPSTKIGALIVGDDGEGGPWGFNGAPRKCKADEVGDPRGERPEKYYWFEHAERNAIYAAARSGYSTSGRTMIVTHPPCMDCARAIVQAGFKSVIILTNDEDFLSRWKDHAERALVLFEECGVNVLIENYLHE